TQCMHAFTKAMAEGVILARKDSAAAKRAIGKYVKVLVDVLINSFKEPSEIGGAHAQAILQAKAGASIGAALFEHFSQHCPVEIRVGHDAVSVLFEVGFRMHTDDQKMLDASYDAYAPYLETSLAVRDQVIRSELDYLNEKEFPRAKSANPKEFFDNS